MASNGSRTDEGALRQRVDALERQLVEERERLTRELVRARDAEQLLRIRDTHIRAAMASAGALSFEWDILNDRVHRFYGADHVYPETLAHPDTFERVVAAVHPEDRERFRADVQAALVHPDGRYVSEHRTLRPDGEVRWLSESGHVTTDASGRPERLFGISQDVTARRQIEDELRESERFKRELSALAPGVVYVFNLETRCSEYVSRQTHVALGYTDQEIIALGSDFIPQVVHPDDAPELDAYFTRLRDLPDGVTAEIEYRYRHRNGSWRCFLSRDVAYRRGPEGRVRQVLGIATDITSRKQVEDEVRRAEALARDRLAEREQLYRYAPVGLFTFDRDLRFVYVNEEMAAINGLAVDAHVGKQIDDVVPHLAAELREVYRPVLEQGRPVVGVEIQGETPSAPGVIRHFLANYYPLRDGVGHIVGLSGAVLDVTDRVRAERALHTSEERFRLMADQAPVLIWVNDLDGCEFVNRAYLDFLGVDVDAIRGTDWIRFVHPQDCDEYVRGYESAVRDRVRFEGRFRFRRADGEYRWMQSVGLPRFEADRLVGFIGTTTDITSIVQAEQDAAEAARQKDEFIAVLAHELRNPLAPVRTATALLRARGGGDPVVAKCRDIIDRQVSQMARLLDDLLDVSRLSRGQLTLHRHPVRLSDVIDAAVETARPGIDERHQHLQIEPVDPALVLDGDETRLTQVFANLLNNASKYTNPGGRISVSTLRQGARVAVAVRDTGVGIDPALGSRIFDLFTQADDARQRADGGLGIGLGLTRRLVEMHGGTIEVESAGRNCGATFTVTLPIDATVRATVDEEQRTPAHHVVSATRRVLVVDDNADAADTLAMLIESLGCEVRTTYDGEAALGMARAFRPDLVLLDLGMPGVTGQAVCQRLRKEPYGAHAYIVAVTGWGQDDDRRRTQVAGFDLHLVKPVEPDVIAHLVRQLPASQR